MKKNLFIFFVFILCVGFSYSQVQVNPELTQNENSLEFIINARIIGEETNVLWSTEKSASLVSGKAVQIKITGKNIILLVSFTPYLETNGNVLVIAQSHIWYSSSNIVRYYTNIKSLRVQRGENFIFLPFGKKNKKMSLNKNVELEIKIGP